VTYRAFASCTAGLARTQIEPRRLGPRVVVVLDALCRHWLANWATPFSGIEIIGMDVHQEAILITVLNGSDKLVMETILETKASSIVQFLRGLRGELHVTWENEPGRPGCTICCSSRCSKFWSAIRAVMLTTQLQLCPYHGGDPEAIPS
jgi:hypothetical protein